MFAVEDSDRGAPSKGESLSTMGPKGGTLSTGGAGASSAEVATKAGGAEPVKLDELYREIILDHFRHPHHHEPVSNPDIAAKGLNPLCGDELSLQVKLDEKGAIARVGVQARGCSISTASSSMMTDVMEGKTVQEALGLVEAMKNMMKGEKPSEELGDAESLAGVRKFPTRVKCALLAWTTLEEAMNQKPASQATVHGHEG